MASHFFEALQDLRISPVRQARFLPNRIRVNRDILSYRLHTGAPVGTYIAANALTLDNNYFEVEILDKGTNGTIGVGLVTQGYPLNAQPGWMDPSVAYHGDDGKIFESTGYGRPFGPTFDPGDKIGCGIRQLVKQRSVTIFFTRNGREIGTVSLDLPQGGFYPAVGMHSQGEKVRLIMTATWPPVEELTKATGQATFPPERIQVSQSIIRYKPNPGKLVGTYIAANPLRSDNNYFEVEILDTGERGTIGVGLVTQGYQLDAQPGWMDPSVAYHGDDGKLFESTGYGRPFGPTFCPGDKIGCGIRQLGPRSVTVFFTRNGSEMDTVTLDQPQGGFHPAVGMHSDGEKVRWIHEASWPPNAQVTISEAEARFPTDRINVHDNILSYKPNRGTLVGTYIAANPLRSYNNYFEVEIVNTGKRGRIGVGLVTYGYPLDAHPGWKLSSVGYHGDDGRLFLSGAHSRPFGPTFNRGDKIGCGVKFDEAKRSRNDVYFTRNGTHLGTVTLDVSPYSLHPAVSLHSHGEEVRLILMNETVAQDVVKTTQEGDCLEVNFQETVSRNPGLRAESTQLVNAPVVKPKQREKNVNVRTSAAKVQSGFSVGDEVKLIDDIGKIKLLQQGHGGWNKDMRNAITLVGTVVEIDSDGDINVDFDGNTWTVNPEVCCAAGVSFSVGDRVKLDKDLEFVQRMQKGHGGWNMQLKRCVNMVGTVEAIDEDGDLDVNFGEATWTLNPKVCHLAEVEPVRSEGQDEDIDLPTGNESTGPSSGNSFNVDDQIKISVSPEKLKNLQKGHGGWNEGLVKAIGAIGLLTNVDSNGDLCVKFPQGTYTLNPEACVSLNPTKLKQPHGSSIAPSGQTLSTPRDETDTGNVSKYEDSKYQCPICQEERINVIFNCGHGTCQECSKSLDLCHMCRNQIVLRTKMFV